MPELSAHLNSIDLSHQRHFSHLEKLLWRAEARVTRWGSREVTIYGYAGSVSLDAIAKKILKASKEHSAADDLLPVNQIAGVGMVRALQSLYIMSDEQLKNSHFFTKFLNWIREIPFSLQEFPFEMYTTQFLIKHRAEGIFLGHSKYKFLARFGGSFDKLGEHPAKAGPFGFPLRIVAHEHYVQALIPGPDRRVFR